MANTINKFFNDFNDITTYYNFLVNKTKNRENVEITNEWLIDNYYLVVEHKNNILKSKKILKKEIKTINSNYYFLKDIVTKRNYNISFKYLIEELNNYQKSNGKVFTYKELSLFFNMLIFIYTEKLNSLCRDEYKKLIDKEDVAKVIRNHEFLRLEDLFPQNFDIMNNYHYILKLIINYHKLVITPLYSKK